MYLDTDYGGHHPHATVAERLAARRELSLIIERALVALDALDGDPDLEPAGDERDDPGDLYEPSIGAHEAVDQLKGWWSTPYNRFLNCADLEADDSDAEHTALERHGKGFVRSGPDDAEDGHDQEEAYR